MLIAPDRVASLRVERRELAALKPHPRNPRVHPKPGTPAWTALQQSLAHDYFDPLVVNVLNEMLVSGHLRHKVLLASGFTHADVSVVEYDEQTHLARLIAANSLLGEWEEQILASLAGELDHAGFASGLAGLTEKDLASYLEGPAVTDDTASAAVILSQAEEVARHWKVNPGDLYAAGEHRILCGDCSIAKSWQTLLGDRLADMVWTDPPYNVDYDSVQQRRIESAA